MNFMVAPLSKKLPFDAFLNIYWDRVMDVFSGDFYLKYPHFAIIIYISNHEDETIERLSVKKGGRVSVRLL